MESEKGRRRAHNRLEVLSAAVALSDGGILAAKEGANRRADNVGAAEDDGVLASNVDAGRLEEEHHSCGGAGREEGSGSTGREKADVIGVETEQMQRMSLQLSLGPTSALTRRRPSQARRPQ